MITNLFSSLLAIYIYLLGEFTVLLTKSTKKMRKKIKNKRVRKKLDFSFGRTESVEMIEEKEKNKYSASYAMHFSELPRTFTV